VMSDPGKLKIILQNLINNAVKFTDAGEIRVAARLDAQRQRMKFIVSDTGIGIASDQLPFGSISFGRSMRLGRVRKAALAWDSTSSKLSVNYWGNNNFQKHTGQRICIYRRVTHGLGRFVSVQFGHALR